MFGWSRRRAGSEAPSKRAIVQLESVPPLVYAIGDVHGCLRELQVLEGMIEADAAGQEALIIYLGDYVDRGPNSAAVLDHLLAKRSSQTATVYLAGNHEQMMLDFLSRPRRDHPWLQYGGKETIMSYGLNAATLFDRGTRAASQRLESFIPTSHQEFLVRLPACLSLPGYCFVHAGLIPGLALGEQTQEAMLWMRPTQGDYQETGPYGVIVHGHTPHQTPVVEPGRICVDTGAFATGVLTAVRLDGSGDHTFLSTPAPPRQRGLSPS